jgi:hypothetical protein
MTGTAADGKVPVGEVVTFAWRFAFASLPSFLPAAAAVGGVGAVAQLVAGFAGGMMLALLALQVASVMFTAAAFRAVLSGAPPSGLGLAFGPAEARLLLVTLVMNLALVLVVALLVTFVLLGAGVSPAELEAAQADPEALGALLERGFGAEAGSWPTLLLLTAGGLAVWIGARLALAQPASFAEGRFMLLATWPWTRGNSLRVLMAMLAVNVPALLFAQIVGTALTLLLAGAGAGGAVIAGGLGAAAGTLASLPSAALAARLFQGLRPG